MKNDQVILVEENNFLRGIMDEASHWKYQDMNRIRENVKFHSSNLLFGLELFSETLNLHQ